MKKSFAFNAFISSAGLSLLVCINVISTPWLLKLMGEETFGLYRLALGTLLSFSLIFESGLGSAAKKVFGDAINSKNKDSIKKATSGLIWSYLAITFYSISAKY